jgi:hypothetical protein
MMMYENNSRERIAQMMQEREQIRLAEEAKAGQKQNEPAKASSGQRSFFSRLFGLNNPKVVPAVDSSVNQNC